jgi:hypothetical protein
MTLFKTLNSEKQIITFGPGDLIEGNEAYPVSSTASGCPITGLSFSDNISERMYNSFEIPSNLVDGSDITVRVHYFNSTTQSGQTSCSWVIDYQVFSDLDNIQDKITTRAGVSSNLPDSAVADTYIKSIITISGSDVNNPISKDSFLAFSVCRDCGCGTDTMLDDAVLALLTFELEVEV